MPSLRRWRPTPQQMKWNNDTSNDHTRTTDHFMILRCLNFRSSQELCKMVVRTFRTHYDLTDVDLPCLVYDVEAHTLANEAEQ